MNTCLEFKLLVLFDSMPSNWVFPSSRQRKEADIQSLDLCRTVLICFRPAALVRWWVIYSEVSTLWPLFCPPAQSLTKNVQVETFDIKYSLHSGLYSWDMHTFTPSSVFLYTLTAVKMSEAPSEAPPAVVCGGWAQQGSPLLINGTTSAPFN